MYYIHALKAYLKFEGFQRAILRFFSESFRPNGAAHGTKKKPKEFLNEPFFLRVYYVVYGTYLQRFRKSCVILSQNVV